MRPPDLLRAKREPLVLVIDDDPLIRLTICAVLRRSAFSVVEADNGAHGLRLARSEQPDLIILDLQMPGMDGFDVCARLRGEPALAETPVLVLTGSEDTETIQRVFEAGATDFSPKPVSPVLLSHRVRFLLRSVATTTQLRQSEARLAAAQRLARLGSWECTPATGTVVGSPEAFAIVGLERHDARCQLAELGGLVVAGDRERVERLVRAAIADLGALDIECRITPAAAEVRHVHLLGQVHRDGPDGTLRLAGTIQDVTERARAAERIRTLAYFDSLTGLPNRLLFTEKVRMALSMARRSGGRLALLLLDLDNFKGINDTLGHSAGDRVLREVGTRLREAVRDHDVVSHDAVLDDFCSVARLGGDEFLVAATDLGSREDASRIADRLLLAMRRPIALESGEVYAGTSIGISIFPDDGTEFEELFKNADVALYHAKSIGRNGAAFFDAGMNDAAMLRSRIEHGLRQSLARDEMRLDYQPQIDVNTGCVVGVEALLRWDHPDLGAVNPTQFIALAERIGLITELTEFTLNVACHQLVAWREEGHQDLRLAINLSPKLFTKPAILARLVEIPARLGVESAAIEFEITETALIENPAEVRRGLSMLRQQGFRLALDDFGVGFSSLSHLRDFELHSLKIDRSFIGDIATGPRELAIVSSLIDLANRLGIEPVAEGIENDAQRELLRAAGCHVMQGILIGRPTSASGITERLAGQRADG